MVKSIAPVAISDSSIPNQASQSGVTWSGLMKEYVANLQGIYYEVHVECSNPDVSKMQPIKLNSEHNLPEQYPGPESGLTKFEFQLEQIEKYKKIDELLHSDASLIQRTLEENYASKPDEYRVIILKRRLS